MTLVSLHLFCFVPSVNATKTLTLNPIAWRCLSNIGAGEEDLTVRYEQGLVWISYLAFNLSEIPPGASIDSAILKLKTRVVITSAYISAYCSSNAEWVKTGMSWDTKPDVDDYATAEWVSAWEEWYFWEMKKEVSDAFAETGELTVALKSGLLVNQKGFAIFYPDAKLEITYTIDTSAPTYSNISGQPGSPTPDDEVIVSVTATDDKSGVKEMYLYYSTDGGVNWVKVLTSPIGDSKYEATIPQQSEDTTVQYYIEAFDNALNKAKSETSSYAVKSSAEILPYGLIGVFVLFGVSIIIGILIFRFIRKKRKGRGSVESIVNYYARSINFPSFGNTYKEVKVCVCVRFSTLNSLSFPLRNLSPLY